MPSPHGKQIPHSVQVKTNRQKRNVSMGRVRLQCGGEDSSLTRIGLNQLSHEELKDKGRKDYEVLNRRTGVNYSIIEVVTIGNEILPEILGALFPRFTI